MNIQVQIRPEWLPAGSGGTLLPLCYGLLFAAPRRHFR